MKLVTRRSVLKSVVASSLVPAAPGLIGSAQASSTNLTVASLFGDDKPETRIWVRISELVEARLPGQFKFNIVKNGALGGEKEVAESARLGSIQAGLSTVSSLSGWVPEVQVLDLPFLFRDDSHVRKTVNGGVGADLREKLAAQNFVVGDFINYGARHLLTKDPVTRPKQLKGKKIRIIQSTLHSRLWSAFGTIPVGIPITETYNALATGVADAMDLTKSAYASFKLYEVVPCMTETGHIRASGVIFYSAAFWGQLSDEQKTVFLEASSEAASYFNQLILDDEAAAIATSLAHGGKLLQPEALDEWQQGAQSVWQYFAPVVGGIERIRKIHQAAG